MMSDRQAYFARAESWATDQQFQFARSRRMAWTIAGIAAGVAALAVVAVALLVPLKTVQLVTLLVDRQTGFVQALDPERPNRIAADEALTQALLAQYVTAREGFDRATVALDYRRVGLWSAGPARTSYLALMPASNPQSPLNAYPAGTVVSARVKSVSRLSADTALVRFDTQIVDRNAQAQPVQQWLSVIRYKFSNAPMRMEDRLINPLGLQVTSYRRDAEAPPLPTAPPIATERQGGAVSSSDGEVLVDENGRVLRRVRVVQPARGAAPRAMQPQALGSVGQ